MGKILGVVAVLLAQSSFAGNYGAYEFRFKTSEKVSKVSKTSKKEILRQVREEMPTREQFKYHSADDLAAILEDVIFDGKVPAGIDLLTIADKMLNGGELAGQAYAHLAQAADRGNGRMLGILQNPEIYASKGLSDFDAARLRWAMDQTDGVLADKAFENVEKPTITRPSLQYRTAEEIVAESEAVRTALYDTLKPNQRVLALLKKELSEKFEQESEQTFDATLEALIPLKGLHSFEKRAVLMEMKQIRNFEKLESMHDIFEMQESVRPMDIQDRLPVKSIYRSLKRLLPIEAAK